MSDRLRLPASKASTWYHCTAAPAEIDRLGPLPGSREDEPSIAILEGNTFHWALEQTLLDWDQNGQMFPAAVLGRTAPKGLEVSSKMVRHVSKIADYVVQRKEEMGPGTKVFVEVKDVAPVYDVDVVCKADIMLVGEHSAEYIDAKYGEGLLVDVNDCEQLLVYMVMDQLKPVRAGHREARITVAQPRIPHEDGVIRSRVFTPGEIRALTDTLLARCKIISSGQGEFYPNPKSCWHCAAKPSPRRPIGCRAYLLRVGRGLGYLDEMTHMNILTLPDNLPCVEDLSGEELSQYLAIKGAVYSFFEALEEYAEMRVTEDPASVPNYGLEPGKGRREYVAEFCDEAGRPDEEKIVKVLKNRYKLKDADIRPKKLLSLPQLDKLIAGLDDISPILRAKWGKMWTLVPGKPKLTATVTNSPMALPENDDIFGELAGDFGLDDLFEPNPVGTSQGDDTPVDPMGMFE